MAEKTCFLDKDRSCVAGCKAFDEKNQDCRVIKGVSTLANNFGVWTKWLQHHDPPKPG